jgi:dTDP-4-amino-4,6-dideoxygalactose transaminase
VHWIKTPYEHPKAYHVYHQYTIRILNGKRDEFQKLLKEKGIQTMIYYPVPLHKMKVFAKNGMEISGDLKEVQKAEKEVLSLPISNFNTEFLKGI